MKHKSKKRSIRTRAKYKQLLATASCSISTFILGSLLGWPSPVLVKIRETGRPMKLNNNQISWMVSLLYLGNFVSPIPTGFMMDYFGRKRSLLILAVLPMIAWIMIYTAKSAYFLYGARFLAGMWNGVVSTVVPMYVAEICEAKNRGTMSTLIQITSSIGVLAVYIIGSKVSYGVLALIFGSFSILFVVCFMFVPESPYYLVMKKKKRAAIKSLMWLRCRNDRGVRTELKILRRSIIREQRHKGTFRELFGKKNRKAFIIVEFLAIFQRLSGVSVLLAYTSITLPREGIGKLKPNDCVIVMGTMWVISVILATFLIDHVGRKPLLIVSSLGCSASMLVGGLWFFLSERTSVNVKPFYWIPFASILVHCLTYGMGLGAVTTVIQGEMFPTNIKGIASGITAEVYSATSLLTNKIYIPIQEHVGSYLNFWIFSLSCFTASIFTIFFVKETKGKTLQQIHREMR